MAPVLQQARGFRRHLPGARRKASPLRYMRANLINDGSDVILLFLIREALALVEHHLLLGSLAFALLWLWNRRNELSAPALIDDLLGRLTILVELPMAIGELVRRVEDRLFEECVGHGSQTRRNRTHPSCDNLNWSTRNPAVVQARAQGLLATSR